MEKKPQRIRRDPRVSVNQLGEYLVGGALGRRRIIATQREPLDYLVPRYRAATDAITKFLMARTADTTALQGTMHSLSTGSPVPKKWDAINRSNCSDAIDCFLRLQSRLVLGDRVALPRRGTGMIQIRGVEVSVRPEALVSAVVNGERVIGAVKLWFSKTKKVTPEAALYAATVLYEYLAEAYPGTTVARSLCQVVDVFGEKIYTTPSAIKKRMREVQAACEEIVAGWGKNADAA